MSLLKQINEEIAEFQKNSAEFENGKKVAGARARKNSSNLTKLFKQYRAETIAQGK